MTRIIDPSGSITYTYDQHGRIRSKTQISTGRTFTVQYRYDAFGRMDQLILPSGRIVNYGFDAQGRVATLSLSALPLVTDVSYHPFGMPNYFVFGNGSEVFRLFDQNGRLQLYTRNTESMFIDYDPANRISGLYNLDNPDQYQLFGYDALSRLNAYLDPAQSQTFGYDANGNRRAQTIGADQYTYLYPPTSNRLTSVDLVPPLSFSYDNTGNVRNDGSHAYTYDGRSRLVQADSTTYTINGLGQRVRKAGPSVPNSVNYFVYDENGRLLGEYDASGNLLQEIVYLGDMPINILRPGAPTTIYNVYADHLGTPRLITDQNNQVVWRWDSEPFGNSAADENPSGLGIFRFNLRFPGQYFDQETGNHYNYFRDCYDPATGRYCQSDPIGLAGGINTYAYVSGNPISRIDPTGLWDDGRRGGGNGSGGGSPDDRCRLLQQVGPLGIQSFIGFPRLLYLCIYDCGKQCPSNDIVFDWVWMWNPPYNCESIIRRGKR